MQWRYECNSGKETETPVHGHVGPGQSNTGPEGRTVSAWSVFCAASCTCWPNAWNMNRPWNHQMVRNAHIKIIGACRYPHVSGFAHPLNYPYGRKKGQPLLLLASSFQPNAEQTPRRWMEQARTPHTTRMKIRMQVRQRKTCACHCVELQARTKTSARDLFLWPSLIHRL